MPQVPEKYSKKQMIAQSKRSLVEFKTCPVSQNSHFRKDARQFILEKAALLEIMRMSSVLQPIDSSNGIKHFTIYCSYTSTFISNCFFFVVIFIFLCRLYGSFVALSLS